MSSVDESSIEFSDSDVESHIVAPKLQNANIKAPDEGGADYLFLTDSDTRSRSTHDLHVSLHNMTPSITSAALTERSGFSSHGVEAAFHTHLMRNDGIAEEDSLASLNSSEISDTDESMSSFSEFETSISQSHINEQTRNPASLQPIKEHNVEPRIVHQEGRLSSNVNEESLASLSSDDASLISDGSLLHDVASICEQVTNDEAAYIEALSDVTISSCSSSDNNYTSDDSDNIIDSNFEATRLPQQPSSSSESSLALSGSPSVAMSKRTSNNSNEPNLLAQAEDEENQSSAVKSSSKSAASTQDRASPAIPQHRPVESISTATFVDSSSDTRPSLELLEDPSLDQDEAHRSDASNKHPPAPSPKMQLAHDSFEETSLSDVTISCDESDFDLESTAEPGIAGEHSELAARIRSAFTENPMQQEPRVNRECDAREDSRESLHHGSQKDHCGEMNIEEAEVYDRSYVSAVDSGDNVTASVMPAAVTVPVTILSPTKDGTDSDFSIDSYHSIDSYGRSDDDLPSDSALNQAYPTIAPVAAPDVGSEHSEISSFSNQENTQTNSMQEKAEVKKFHSVDSSVKDELIEEIMKQRSLVSESFAIDDDIAARMSKLIGLWDKKEGQGNNDEQSKAQELVLDDLSTEKRDPLTNTFQNDSTIAPTVPLFHESMSRLTYIEEIIKNVHHPPSEQSVQLPPSTPVKPSSKIKETNREKKEVILSATFDTSHMIRLKLRKEIISVYRSSDKDKNGTLSYDEFVKFLQSLGFFKTPEPERPEYLTSFPNNLRKSTDAAAEYPFPNASYTIRELKNRCYLMAVALSWVEYECETKVTDDTETYIYYLSSKQLSHPGVADEVSLDGSVKFVQLVYGLDHVTDAVLCNIIDEMKTMRYVNQKQKMMVSPPVSPKKTLPATSFAAKLSPKNETRMKYRSRRWEKTVDEVSYHTDKELTFKPQLRRPPRSIQRKLDASKELQRPAVERLSSPRRNQRRSKFKSTADAEFEEHCRFRPKLGPRCPFVSPRTLDMAISEVQRPRPPPPPPPVVHVNLGPDDNSQVPVGAGGHTVADAIARERAAIQLVPGRNIYYYNVQSPPCHAVRVYNVPFAPPLPHWAFSVTKPQPEEVLGGDGEEKPKFQRAEKKPQEAVSDKPSWQSVLSELSGKIGKGAQLKKVQKKKVKKLKMSKKKRVHGFVDLIDELSFTLAKLRGDTPVNEDEEEEEEEEVEEIEVVETVDVEEEEELPTPTATTPKAGRLTNVVEADFLNKLAGLIAPEVKAPTRAPSQARRRPSKIGIKPFVKTIHPPGDPSKPPSTLKVAVISKKPIPRAPNLPGMHEWSPPILPNVDFVKQPGVSSAPPPCVEPENATKFVPTGYYIPASGKIVVPAEDIKLAGKVGDSAELDAEVRAWIHQTSTGSDAPYVPTRRRRKIAVPQNGSSTSKEHVVSEDIDEMSSCSVVSILLEGKKTLGDLPVPNGYYHALEHRKAALAEREELKRVEHAVELRNDFPEPGPLQTTTPEEFGMYYTKRMNEKAEIGGKFARKPPKVIEKAPEDHAYLTVKEVSKWKDNLRSSGDIEGTPIIYTVADLQADLSKPLTRGGCIKSYPAQPRPKANPPTLKSQHRSDQRKLKEAYKLHIEEKIRNERRKQREIQREKYYRQSKQVAKRVASINGSASDDVSVMSDWGSRYDRLVSKYGSAYGVSEDVERAYAAELDYILDHINPPLPPPESQEAPPPTEDDFASDDDYTAVVSLQASPIGDAATLEYYEPSSSYNFVASAPASDLSPTWPAQTTVPSARSAPFRQARYDERRQEAEMQMYATPSTIDVRRIPHKKIQTALTEEAIKSLSPKKWDRNVNLRSDLDRPKYHAENISRMSTSPPRTARKKDRPLEVLTEQIPSWFMEFDKSHASSKLDIPQHIIIQQHSDIDDLTQASYASPMAHEAHDKSVTSARIMSKHSSQSPTIHSIHSSSSVVSRDVSVSSQMVYKNTTPQNGADSTHHSDNPPLPSSDSVRSMRDAGISPIDTPIDPCANMSLVPDRRLSADRAIRRSSLSSLQNLPSNTMLKQARRMSETRRNSFSTENIRYVPPTIPMLSKVYCPYPTNLVEQIGQTLRSSQRNAQIQEEGDADNSPSGDVADDVISYSIDLDDIYCDKDDEDLVRLYDRKSSFDFGEYS